MGNIEGCVELNCKILYASNLSKMYICNDFRAAMEINVKLSEHAEGDVEKWSQTLKNSLSSCEERLER